MTVYEVKSTAVFRSFHNLSFVLLGDDLSDERLPKARIQVSLVLWDLLSRLDKVSSFFNFYAVSWVCLLR